MKKCSKCGEEKELAEFCKGKTFCKSCKAFVNQVYRQTNKEKIRAKKREYSKKNKEKIATHRRKYREANKEKIVASKREYREANKEKITTHKREYYEANKENVATYLRDYYKKNKEKVRQYQQANKEIIAAHSREYRRVNKEAIAVQRRKYNAFNKEKIRVYKNQRYADDPEYRIKARLRARLTACYKAYSTKDKQFRSCKLGIDWNAIIKHLGPCPGPREDWHIDHIVPLCKFDFNKPEEIRKAFAPENHQWLTKEENRRKYNRVAELAEHKDSNFSIG